MTDIVERLCETAGQLIHGTMSDGDVPVAMLVEASDEIERLRDALAIFLGYDDRFQIAVGGNPIAVAEMMESAHAALARVAFTSGIREGK